MSYELFYSFVSVLFLFLSDKKMKKNEITSAK